MLNKNIKTILSKAYFIGGSPCSGKSTTAKCISNKYNIEYFKIDDYQQKHLEQANPDNHPTMYKYFNMDWNEMWMRSIDLQVKEVFKIYKERFNMILRELEQFDKKTVLVEGAELLPELLNSINIKKEQVIYMIPSKGFQVKKYSEREWINDILSKCNNSKKAFENWMERDHKCGKRIMAQAEEYGYKIIYVDGKKSIDNNIEIIERYLGLS